MSDAAADDTRPGVAIIGMSGRFPGAASPDELWKNIRDGVESISFFSVEELEQAGIDHAELDDPRYVKAKGFLAGADMFDTTFFGMNPREAELTDPQQRVFLECAWEAIENAGYDPESYGGTIGVYAGASGMNTYFLENLHTNRDLFKAAGYQIMVANDKDFLSTRVAYKLNLRGPSMSIQTGCSTSLVAVATAVQSLLSYQCDMALAGGVSVSVPLKSGYLHREGMILSSDGHCRAFDAAGQGIVPGNGAGIVVLKRVEDAIADGDQIYAVIRGVALNNDGSQKVGFTAPSVDGQCAAITQAMAIAEVSPETISYVEAHGTGTPLGDPIEIAALTRAFRLGTQKKRFCAIGSVKTNIGHLDSAAGIAGLIKTVQALRHRLLPPSLHFNTSNPEIDFENSPFFVSTALAEWKREGTTPRRAGVSSFGIGGTNAHLILEEAPPAEPSGEQRPWHLLVLSARTEAALGAAAANLIAHLDQNPDASLADVAYTLQVGRRAWNHRWMLVADSPADATIAATTLGSRRVFKRVKEEGKEPPVVFMFPGGGAQYLHMAADLYESEPLFREIVDRCARLLEPHLGLDLRRVLYPAEGDSEKAAEALKQSTVMQPAIFTISYALANLWMQWGVRPAAMIGYSLGEFVAATIAGVFSLGDALHLVATRARMMQEMPPGTMLSVPLTAAEVVPLLGPALSLAAINGPALCVVSGTTEAVAALESTLLDRNIEGQRLQTSHGYHSWMMEPAVQPFLEVVRRVPLKPPQIPIASNVTGDWLTPAQAISPEHWATHMRKPVLFAEGIARVLEDPARILLEVGPGRTLSTLVREHPNRGSQRLVLPSIRHPYDRQSDVGFLLTTMGQLWLAGVTLRWSDLYAGQPRRRVPLPTYPFERQRYWLDAVKPQALPLPDHGESAREQRAEVQFSEPCWIRAAAPAPIAVRAKECCVVFEEPYGLGRKVAERLARLRHDVVHVRAGNGFSRESEGSYTVNPRRREDFASLLRELRAQGKIATAIAFFWGVTSPVARGTALHRFDEAQTLGFQSLMALAQAFGSQKAAIAEVQIAVVTNGMQKVGGAPLLYPEKATVLGPCRVIPKEYRNIACFSVDIELPALNSPAEEKLEEQLLAEIMGHHPEPMVAYRNGERWVQSFGALRLEEPTQAASRVREGGVYLVTDGLHGVGLAVAEHLVKTARVKLIVTAPAAVPAQDASPQSLASPTSARNGPSSSTLTDALGLPVGKGSRVRETAQLRVLAVHALERRGGDVLTVAVNLASVEDMRDAIAQGIARFGRIDGIIHAPPHATEGVIQHKAPQTSASVFLHKARGALALDAAARDLKLDFFAICSSLTSFTGEFGQVDDCASNAFLDAFASSRAERPGVFTTCIHWDHEEALSATSFSRILCSTHTQTIATRKEILTLLEEKSRPNSPLLTSDSAKDSIPQSVHSRPALGSTYVAPRNAIETTICSLWKKYFGIEQVGIHDDFFALGGDSLLAVQVVSRLRDLAQMDLPSHVLIGAPTVAALAELIMSADSPTSLSFSARPSAKAPPPGLVKIKPGGQRRPLFLVHPVGGHVYVYRHLASCLHPDQPVYGLQARGSDDDSEPCTSLEEMAASYLEAIRTVQAEGPYLLGGSSFGGVVAYEMAQQLRSKGQRAAMLTMFDTPTPDQVPDGAENSVETLAYLLSGNPSISPPSARNGRDLDEQLLDLVKSGGIINQMSPSLALPQLKRFHQMVSANLRILRRYVPRPYAGRLLYFAARERDALTAHGAERGWSGLALEGMTLHEVPGNHITMNLPPHVETLATLLEPAITEASTALP